MSVTLNGAAGTYDILVDGEMVGYIEGNTGTLLQIDVLEEHQGNGYGTAAVRQFIERARRASVERVETSAVVSPAMESIVVSLGFERCADDPSHWCLRLDE
jgi:GNAT superfamily N-acetyltransferase